MGSGAEPASLRGLLFEHALFQFLGYVAYPETALAVAGSLGSTLFFCYYVDPGSGLALAARMNFTLIATAVLFPALFMVRTTELRRYKAITLLSSFKAQLCQLELGLLTWRSSLRPDMPREWDQRAVDACVEYALVLSSILTLPPMLLRHLYSERGLAFYRRVDAVRRRRLVRLTVLEIELNSLVEDLKEHGLTPQESIRLFEYTMRLANFAQQLMSTKQYRSSEVARAFSRVVLFVCILFYGPYYSMVAGNLKGAGGVDVLFACCLTLVSTLTLLSVVAMQRGVEDAFTSGRSAVKTAGEARTLACTLRELHALQQQRRSM